MSFWKRFSPEYRVTRAYQQLFQADNGALNEAAKVVLADLGRYCYAMTSTASLDDRGRVDPVAMIERDGRRAVLMRIHTFLGIDLARMVEIENDERAIQETNLGP